MSTPTRQQHTALTRELKQCAFEQSPMFAHDEIRKMSTEFSIDIIDDIPQDLPDEALERFKLSSSITTISLGMSAVRLVGTVSRKPVYIFDVWQNFTRELTSADLRLSPSAWETLREWYFTEDQTLLENGKPIDKSIMQSAIRDQLHDDEIECYEHHHTGYNFDTSKDARHHGIGYYYQRSVSIGNDNIDLAGTHIAYSNGEVEINTPDGWMVRPVLLDDGPDDVSAMAFADVVEANVTFDEIIRDTGLDDEVRYDMLTLHEDKAKEMLFLVECLRQRRIPVS